MIVIYIAGPFRGENAWEIEKNIRHAETQAFEIAKLGVMPLCPHTNTRFFHGTLSDDFWLEGTLELLTRCDAIYLIPGWEKSFGAREEAKHARLLKLPSFQTLEEVRSFLLQAEIAELDPAVRRRLERSA